MYFLVMEFQNNPVLCPPFSLIFYVGYAAIYIFKEIIRPKNHRKSESFFILEVYYHMCHIIILLFKFINGYHENVSCIFIYI